MANEPTLLTARLHLSAFTPDDAEDVFAYASLDEVSRYMTFESHASLADSQRFIERVSNAPSTQLDWAVREQGDEVVRGAIVWGVDREAWAAQEWARGDPRVESSA